MRALRQTIASDRGVAAALVLRLLLGGLLLYAALAKLPAPQAFAQDVANYRILPGALVPLAAVGLLGVEVVLGVALLLGLWLAEAALLTSLVLALFTAAVATALGRGLQIECGCFGSGGSPATRWTLLRDLAFLAAAAALTVLTWRRPPGGASPTAPR